MTDVRESEVDSGIVEDLNSTKEAVIDLENEEKTVNEAAECETVEVKDTEPETVDRVAVDKKSESVQIGEKRDISPNLLADLRKKEKNTFNSNKVSNFFTLCAGAEMLLPNTQSGCKKPSKPAISTAEDAKTDDKDEKKSKSSSSRSRYFWTDDDGDSQSSEREKGRYANREHEEYYCDLCDSYSNSMQSYTSHIQGKKHQKRLAASGGHSDLNIYYDDSFDIPFSGFDETIPPNRIKKHGCTPHIQNALDRTKSPCVGLSHITEIWKLDITLDPLYICHLCNAVCQQSTVISHIIGYKHRLNYIKMAEPQTYAEIRVISVKKSELTKILDDNAKAIEERDGRGKVVVEEETDEYDDMTVYQNRGRPSPDLPQFNPSPFQVEQVRFLPPGIRMEMLEELSQINASEIITDTDANRLDYVISNLRRSVLQYKGMTPDTHAPLHTDDGIRQMTPVGYSRPSRGRGPTGMWRPLINNNDSYRSVDHSQSYYSQL